MTIPVRSWSHTDNLGAAFLADMRMEVNLARPVCLTEKLDGSNCAFHVKRDNKQWSLVAIQGRNQHVWVPTPAIALNTEGATLQERAANQKGIVNVGYGNVGALEAIPAYAAHVAAAVGDAIGAEELMLFGEVFRAKSAKKAQLHASFHPFGYKVILPEGAKPVATSSVAATDDEVDSDGHGSEEGDNVITVRLNSKTHALFTALAVNPPPAGHTGGDALQEYLLGTKDFVVCPPAIVYAGALYDGIDQLGQALHTASPFLEGFFIASDDDLPRGLYCKWKTPLFEEQKNAPSLDELCAVRWAYGESGKVRGRTKLPEILLDLSSRRTAGGQTVLEETRAAIPTALVRAFDIVVGLIAKSAEAKAAHKPLKTAKATGGEKPVKVMKQYEEALRARIMTAFARELTKDPALSALPDVKQRKPIAERVCTAVVKEVLEQMEADGEEATKEMQTDLARWTTTALVPIVMKGDFDGYRCSGRS